MKQTIGNKKLGNIAGLLVVIGLVALLILVNFASSLFLAPLIGYNPAALVFWIIGGIIAFIVLRVFISRIQYEMDEDVLVISRIYGKKARPIENIFLRQLVFVGTPEEAEKRNPKLAKVKALHSRCKLPVTAVVYKTSTRPRMALLQLNDEMKAALMEQLKGK